MILGGRRLRECVRPLNVLLSMSLLLLAGCTIHGHLYNLTTGEVTDVRFTYSGSGHGTISGQFRSGEQFHGDYTTFVLRNCHCLRGSGIPWRLRVHYVGTYPRSRRVQRK